MLKSQLTIFVLNWNITEIISKNIGGGGINVKETIIKIIRILIPKSMFFVLRRICDHTKDYKII